MPGANPIGRKSRADVGAQARSFADWSRQRPDIDRDVQQVRAHLITIGARISHDNDKIARTYGITGSDMRILFTLLRLGHPAGMRHTDLFEALLIPSATMTRQIERLAQKQYVERSPDPHDGRVVLVNLTDKGALVANAALTEGVLRSRVSRELQTVLSSQELATLKALLARVTASLI